MLSFWETVPGEDSSDEDLYSSESESDEEVKETPKPKHDMCFCLIFFYFLNFKMSNVVQEEASNVPIVDNDPIGVELQSFNDVEFLNEFAQYKAIKDEFDYVTQTLITTTARMVELQRRSVDLQAKLDEAESAIKNKFIVLRKE